MESRDLSQIFLGKTAGDLEKYWDIADETPGEQTTINGVSITKGEIAQELAKRMVKDAGTKQEVLAQSGWPLPESQREINKIGCDEVKAVLERTGKNK